MSIKHDINFKRIYKNKSPYNKDNFIDYKKIRLASDNRNFKKPKNVSVKVVNNEIFSGEILTKNNNNKDSIVLYIHGGGFCYGSSKSRRFFTYYLANNLNYDIYSIDYPLSPENKYPIALNYLYKVYLYFVSKYNSNISIISDSAGSNLALSLLQMAIDYKVILPKSLVLISPVTQLYLKTESFIKNNKTDCMCDYTFYEEVYNTYLDNNTSDLDNKYISPLNGNYDNFSNTLLIASDSEMLRDDAILLHEKIKNSTLLLAHKKMHAFVLFTNFLESRKYLNKVFKFINKNFK